MPFAALVIMAFVLAMVFRKRANRSTYLLFAVGAAAATAYFLR